MLHTSRTGISSSGGGDAAGESGIVIAIGFRTTGVSLGKRCLRDGGAPCAEID
jgi:hypothetical protein